MAWAGSTPNRENFPLHGFEKISPENPLTHKYHSDISVMSENWRTRMNDVTTAKELDGHTEERDFVELGVVSEDTHGQWLGTYMDGGLGYFG
jgi:hypothetical protein